MPTNLPPEYYSAEKKYKEAESISAKISSLEELVSIIPKHKGTDKLRADLRRKLSKLNDEQQKKKSLGKHKSDYHIDKEGAIRVVLTGPPNSGKSSILDALTNAEPKISDYPYTTWLPLPGMMPVLDIKVQLVDTPPLNTEHIEPELFDLLKTADLILLVVDLQESPLLRIEQCLPMLEQQKIAPIQFKDRYINEPHMTLLPFIMVVNKNDNEVYDEDFDIFNELCEFKECPTVSISALFKRNFKQLEHLVFEQLNIIRIYSKPPGKDPDMVQPFVLRTGGNIEDLAMKVHKDFAEKLKSARVWGKGVFDGQPVGKDHVLNDQDVVELHI